MMRILGEGGADAPSSGQDGACGSGRRIGRFGPVRHFPSRSLKSTAATTACTDAPGPSQVACPEFPGECRSGAVSATPSRQPAARRGAPERTGGAPDHPRASARRIGVIPTTAMGNPPESTASAGRSRPAARTPGARRRALYAPPPPERRFSANFSAARRSSRRGPLTPPSPAVLRCGVSRMKRCVAEVTGGVLPSARNE
jgi:hypothetical protein